MLLFVVLLEEAQLRFDRPSPRYLAFWVDMRQPLNPVRAAHRDEEEIGLALGQFRDERVAC